MRDIVSELGTISTGMSDLTVVKTTQTSPAVALAGYDGCMVYILVDQYTDGTMTPVIQVAPDNNGSPGTWSAAPATDLIAWQATSASNATPVKLNDSNGLPTGNTQPNAISSSGTALNQRVGYIGGVAGTSDWLRVVSTISGSPATGMGYDVVIVRGRPRTLPANI